MGRCTGDRRPGMTRRGFLLGTAAGLAGGIPLGLLGRRGLESHLQEPQSPRSFTGRTEEVKHPAMGMPGSFPGRVVEVRHPDAVRPDHTVNGNAVNAMVDRGMCSLTGADDPREAWRRFFEKDDIVGIKVNPVGRKPNSNEPGRPAGTVGAISSPQLLLKVVRSLK